jgi:hypothetical protein
MLKLKISYPDKVDEKIILERMTHSVAKINSVIDLKEVQKAKDLKSLIAYGASSSRATINLTLAQKLMPFCRAEIMLFRKI